jgi:hypothetical protein
MASALGRCEKKHVNIVSMGDLEAACEWTKSEKGYQPPRLKSEGTVCGRPMVEWALNGREI